jgi:hypothetical protein
VDVIARYTQTFLLPQRYDEGLLVEPAGMTVAQLDKNLHPDCPDVTAGTEQLTKLLHPDPYGDCRNRTIRPAGTT